MQTFNIATYFLVKAIDVFLFKIYQSKISYETYFARKKKVFKDMRFSQKC